MVRGVLVVLSFFLATQTGLSQMSQKPCMPPCDLEALYLASCRNVSDSTTTCMRAWNAFLSAFSEKDPSTVNQTDYDSYFEVLPIVVVRNHALFWSGTFPLAQGISRLDPSICSSFTEPSAASVSGVGEKNECWCGNLTTPGVDCANKCNGVPVTQFWVSFSTMLGQMAEGVVFWLASGERENGTYQNNSFFAVNEFSALEYPRVSRLVVLNVHNRGVGESCGEGTLRILEALSEEKFNASGYMCYDVYGNASLMDTEVVRNIVNIINLEQNGKCTCINILYTMVNTSLW